MLEYTNYVLFQAPEDRSKYHFASDIRSGIESQMKEMQKSVKNVKPKDLSSPIFASGMCDVDILHIMTGSRWVGIKIKSFHSSCIPMLHMMDDIISAIHEHIVVVAHTEPILISKRASQTSCVMMQTVVSVTYYSGVRVITTEKFTIADNNPKHLADILYHNLRDTLSPAKLDIPDEFTLDDIRDITLTIDSLYRDDQVDDNGSKGE